MEENNPQPVALITGAARRIGACIASALHQQGFRIILHCRNSTQDAQQLSHQLLNNRPNSCHILRADLNQLSAIKALANEALETYGRIDVLINNASTFYPTPITEASEQNWDDLFGSNAKAPFFLSQELAENLAKNQGSIINIVDIHADKPLRDHTLYCMAKAANVMLTKSLAKELAPNVRVNGIAPGAILWPEDAAELNTKDKQTILEQIPLAKAGSPEDIATAVVFLAQTNRYITGQIIAIDGGRTLGH